MPDLKISMFKNHTPKFLQESILIAFDFIWKIWLSDRNFATLLDLPLYNNMESF